MSKIITFVFWAFAVGILYLAWITIPYAKGVLSCFDRKISDFDEIEFRTRTQGWAPAARCKLQQTKILDLEQCLSDAKDGRILPVQAEAFVFQVLPYIRPGVANLEYIKNAHDVECVDYPATMFNPTGEE